MKKEKFKIKAFFLILILFSFSTSCTKNDDDNCEEKRAAIYEKYKKRILLENGDLDAIKALEAERTAALFAACD